jgi:ABC-2 type transport system permease protein
MTPAEITDLFKELDMEKNTVKAGTVSKVKGGPLAFMVPFFMVMVIYMTVLLYAVAVMRAVLEEKNSRVMEVLLSSITSKQMMAGKILGVGAVGVTQIAIWVALCIPLAGTAMASGILGAVDLPKAAIWWFAPFFFLGFVLYSTMYAALGAMVNSEQEAQQWQTVIMMPLIMAIMVMMFIIRQPSSPLAFWGSMIPFLSPIVMYARIAVQTPHWYEIAASIAILVATIYGMVALCGRIYRVGILMYGKRPTLPEIMRWIKYA